MYKNLKYIVKRYRIILFNWEYWSFSVLYFPIYFYWVWLSIKAKSFFFFSTSNPTIENAGFIMESKKAIYDLMPKHIYPTTILLQPKTAYTIIENLFEQHKIEFPVVLKPDIGERGTEVKKAFSLNEVFEFIQNTNINFLVQEWCNFKNEIGLFYCKYPNQKTGFISGIVQKEFLTVKGDGVSSIEQLLLQNDRHFLQLPVIKKQDSLILDKVLKLNEEKILVPYGNHCRGTKFIDASNKIDVELSNTFADILNKIPSFYFGRADIRFESFDLLKQGKNFAIIELNGAGSEPTHIYDPKHSIFFAWKEIIKHWKILYTISIQNKHKYKLQFMTLNQGLQLLKHKKRYDKLLYNK